MLASDNNELIDNDDLHSQEDISNICKNINLLKSLYGTNIYSKLFKYLLVSASIKETIDKLTEGKDNVFIVGHKRLDMDALMSCLSFSLICEKKGIKSYIVIDDEFDKIEKVTKSVISDIGNQYNIIKSSDLDNLLTDNSLLVVLDTNKYNLVCVKKYLSKFKDIFILDHHNTDDKTIKTNNLYALDSVFSSTCEAMSILLDLYGIKIDNKFANCILAGIILDTNKFSNNVSPMTHLVASNLIANGADSTKANNMFLEDFDKDRARQRLIDNTEFYVDKNTSCTYAIAIQKDNCKKIYSIEDVAMASSEMLKYAIDASFVIAYTSQDTISVSARSKEIIDVSKIMSNFEIGGGNKHSAAARIKSLTIEEIRDKINEIIQEQKYTNNNEIVLTMSKK